MDEQELVSRLQSGDETAFAQIMSLYKDKIVNYLFQFTRDYQKAVELSQETFLRVYFKADKYKPIASFSSWIYAIATNLAKTEMKKARKLTLVSLDDVTMTLRTRAWSRTSEKPWIISILATGSLLFSKTWRAFPRRRLPRS